MKQISVENYNYNVDVDDEEDYAMNVWAGVLPLRLITEDPKADPRLPGNIPVPDYVVEYKRGRSGRQRS